MNSPVTRVKICGITNRDDAEEAIEAGADALGFNIWSGSPRCIDLEAAAPWIRELPPFVTKVAVAVNPRREEAKALFELSFIDFVQFHGHETPKFCREFAAKACPFMKAISVSGEETLSRPERYGTRHLLLDAHVPGAYGGTGRTFDWDMAARFVEEHPELHVVLSGGLTPANVAQAIRTVRPCAVDVASGVENTARKKDAALVREFIAAVRAA